MTTRTIYVSGTPRGAARPRAGRRGAHTIIYSDPAHEAEMNRAVAEILSTADKAPAIDAMVDVWVDAYFPDADVGPDDIRRRNGKPDGDNVLKLYVDAAVKAGVVADDRLISAWHYTAWSVAPFRAGVRLRFAPPPPPMATPRRPWARVNPDAADMVWVHLGGFPGNQLLELDDARFLVARLADVLGGAR